MNIYVLLEQNLVFKFQKDGFQFGGEKDLLLKKNMKNKLGLFKKFRIVRIILFNYLILYMKNEKVYYIIFVLDNL